MPISKRQNRKQPKKRSAPRLSPSPPLAGSRHCTLVFCSRHSQIEGGVSAGIYNFYRLNGPYDPDTAVLSASTPGLAAIAAMYRGMRVWKTTVSANACAYGDAPASLMLSLVPTAFQPVLPSNPDYWPVQRLAVSTPMRPAGYIGSGVLCQYQAQVSRTFDLPSVANLKRSQYLDEADYATLTNGNPTRQLYCAVAISTNCATAVNAKFHVRISYEIEFFDPYPLQ